MLHPSRLLLLIVVSLCVSVAISAEELPKSYERLCQKGRQQLAKGNLDEAIERYDEAIKQEPNEPLAWVSRGLAHCANHEYKKAETDAKYVLDIDKENLDAQLVLATALRLDKRYEEATEAFKDAISMSESRSADAYAGRGKLYADMHNYRQAITDFSTAIAINPRFEHAYIERAALCMRGGREIGRAIRDYSFVIEELGKATPEYLYLRATARLEGRLFGDAIKDAREVIKAVPDHVAAYGVLVVAHFEQGAYDKADEALKQAEDHAESEPDVRLWRGRLLSTEEKYAEALAQYELALEVKADFLPALEASIDVCRTIEDTERLETLQAEVDRIEADREKRERDEHLLWAVVQGVPGASKDLTEKSVMEIAQRNARDEAAKQLARLYAEQVRKNSRHLQSDCQEIEIAEVVPEECKHAEEIIGRANKQFDEEEYEIAAADFKQGTLRYQAALDTYEGIVSKDHSYWKKWAFERTEKMDDDFAPLMTWLTLAEACHAMGDEAGYESAVNEATSLVNSSGMLNPASGCALMLRLIRLQVRCNDLAGASKAVRAAVDFAEGVADPKTRSLLHSFCAGAAIKCGERELWEVCLPKAIEAAEKADFSPRDLRTRHMYFIKCCAYSEAWATEQAYQQAQELVHFLGERWAKKAQALVAESHAFVALAAMKNGLSSEHEKELHRTAYLKAMHELLASKPSSEFATSPRYVVAKADAVGGEYLRAWCGATILAEPEVMTRVGGRAARRVCELGRLEDARTMCGAFMDRYPSAEALRFLADAEARLGSKSFVELRRWIHKMPQNSGRAAALIGLAAGVKAGRTPNNTAEAAPPARQSGDELVSPTDILDMSAQGDPERAMQLLSRQLNNSGKKKLLKVFDTVAPDAPVWWLKEAEQRISQVEAPHVRAGLWLQIAKIHLASNDMENLQRALDEIDSCWIAMWSRIYTRRCPPTRNRYEGHFYWDYDHDLDEAEVDEIRSMLRTLFVIEEMQTGLGEPEKALETLLLAARCAGRIPRATGFTGGLSPNHATMWMNRISGRLKRRGKETLAQAAISRLPMNMTKWVKPMDRYVYSLGSKEAGDLEELQLMSRLTEEHVRSDYEFNYLARITALSALEAAEEKDMTQYRQAAMRAASQIQRGSREGVAPVMCDLARAAVAADMPDMASEYMERASRHYEDRDLALSEIAQSFAEHGKIEQAEEMAKGISSPIPKAAAYHAIIFAKASQSKDSLSDIYEDIEYYNKPSRQAAGYAAVAEALLSK